MQGKESSELWFATGNADPVYLGVLLLELIIFLSRPSQDARDFCFWRCLLCLNCWPHTMAERPAAASSSFLDCYVSGAAAAP